MQKQKNMLKVWQQRKNDFDKLGSKKIMNDPTLQNIGVAIYTQYELAEKIQKFRNEKKS